MTFTYDLAAIDTNLLAISKVRLEIGDTTSGSGVRASGANLTDEEIAIWLGIEDGDIMLAAARACEMLARDWSKAASFQLGPRREQLSDVAKAYANQASSLRSQYGYGSAGGTVVSGFFQGYADIQEAEQNVMTDEDE